MKTPRIPRAVWVLGVVSLLMDTSSEMIHSLLPVFIVVHLNASATALGVIEGAAEAVSLFTRAFSGALSDLAGRRKPLAVMGYSLSALTKPLFALAGNIQVVFAARFMDRIGKGIRGAPRDAMVADMTDERVRGAAFGLRQSLDSLGAILGPLCAGGLMIVLSGNIRGVFWAAAAPGILAAVLLVTGVREPAQSPSSTTPQRTTFRGALRRLKAPFWIVTIFGSLFTLARFSEAFLLLRAQSLGVKEAHIPLFLMAMNAVYTLSAFPAGFLSDRLGRLGMITAGGAVLVASEIVLALAHSPLTAMAGVALWGLHMGLTQGVFSSLVAQTCPEDLKGSAFGIFSLAGGSAMLLASIIAGVLWDAMGPHATFTAGAVMGSVSIGGLLLMQSRIGSA